MALKLANNAVAQLAAPITDSSNSLSLVPGYGAKFPTLSPGDWFPITVVASDGSLEIMRCTAHAIDTLTVQRAQEGTEAISFAAGSRVELRLTRDAYYAIGQSFQGPDGAVNVGTSDGSNVQAKFDDLESANGASNVGFNAGVGTFARSMQEKGSDTIGLLDFVDKDNDGGNLFFAIERALLSGRTVRAPNGSWNVTWLRKVVAAAGTTLIADPKGAVFNISGDSSIDCCIEIANPRTHVFGINASGQGSSTGIQKFISFTVSEGDTFPYIMFNSLSSWKYGIYLNAPTPNGGGTQVIGFNRFNQVDYPVYSVNSGINISVINNYMLGCLIGIYFGRTTYQPEGCNIQGNKILPNKAGGIGVMLTAGLAMSIVDNVIDQVGAGGCGILLDGSQYQIEGVTTRNHWIGAASGSADCGVKMLGSIRRAHINDEEISGFNYNVFSDKGSNGDTPGVVFINPVVLRPGSNSSPSSQWDVYINDARNVRYGPFNSSSANALFEGSLVTVDASAGPVMSGAVKRAQMAASVINQIAYFGARKSTAPPPVGIGWGISSSQLRIWIDFPFTIRKAVTAIDISLVDDFQVRLPDNTLAPVVGITLAASSDTRMELIVVVGATVSQGLNGALLMKGAVATAYLSVR